MDCFKKKISRKQRLIRERERGAELLEDLIECCDGKSNPIKFFFADQIIKATDNFSDSNHVHKLRSNDFLNWYSGKSKKHPMLLIKKVRMFDLYYHLEYFCRDIAISSMVSGHKNFLKLVGCCLESKEPAMVYDAVKKHYRLDISEQPWKRRMKIAEDIATALAYLHTAFPRPFVYKNMSLEHILLDEDGVAKLYNFSGCISIPEGETFVQVGDTDTDMDLWNDTDTYRDDNYFWNGVVSEKTDVFAIGIVMQKLLTGRKGFDSPRYMFPNRRMEAMEGRRVVEIADPEMVEEMGDISEEELCRMNAFLMLSQRCTGPKGDVQTMVEVAKELRKIQRSIKPDSARDISSSVLSNKT